VFSRIVGRDIIFGDEECAFFLEWLRRLEAFSGIQVISYCLMGNHFHLLVKVPPKPSVISDEEVRRRRSYIYSRKMVEQMELRYKEKREQGNLQYEQDELNKLRNRMFNLPEFIKDLKLRFSKWYNSNHDRKGTLWEERYKCVLVEGSENALMRTAAYIELNPVRAGLVSHPGQYRWTSYTEALAGGKNARHGIQILASGQGKLMDWKTAESVYRRYFEHRSVQQSGRRPSVRVSATAAGSSPDGERRISTGAKDPDPVRRVEPDPPPGRVRYFTEGFILGGRPFIEEFFDEVLKPYRRPPRPVLLIAGDDSCQVYSYRKLVT
jgi:REP element-mobilizing transposase RayT